MKIQINIYISFLVVNEIERLRKITKKNGNLYLQYSSKCSAVEVQVVNIPQGTSKEIDHVSDAPFRLTCSGISCSFETHFEAQNVSLLFLKHSDAVSDTVMKSKK